MFRALFLVLLFLVLTSAITETESGKPRNKDGSSGQGQNGNGSEQRPSVSGPGQTQGGNGSGSGRPEKPAEKPAGEKPAGEKPAGGKDDKDKTKMDPCERSNCSGAGACLLLKIDGQKPVCEVDEVKYPGVFDCKDAKGRYCGEVEKMDLTIKVRGLQPNQGKLKLVNKKDDSTEDFDPASKELKTKVGKTKEVEYDLDMSEVSDDVECEFMEGEVDDKKKLKVVMWKQPLVKWVKCKRKALKKRMKVRVSGLHKGSLDVTDGEATVTIDSDTKEGVLELLQEEMHELALVNLPDDVECKFKKVDNKKLTVRMWGKDKETWVQCRKKKIMKKLLVKIMGKFKGRLTIKNGDEEKVVKEEDVSSYAFLGEEKFLTTVELWVEKGKTYEVQLLKQGLTKGDCKMVDNPTGKQWNREKSLRVRCRRQKRL